MSRNERRHAAAFKAALAHLPEPQREVFRAVAIDSASYAEVSERLGIGTAEVEQLFAAALVALDRALATPPRQGFWQRLARRMMPAPNR